MITDKYRPQRFNEVVGQEHITITLCNALSQKMSAKPSSFSNIAHAYLLFGGHGTGKTTVARILAKAVNCMGNDNPEPCCECEACTSIREERCPDIFEMDAASNRGIDEIRWINDITRYKTEAGIKYRVFIIDEAHMLTKPAFNAMLKTLEEPPPHVIFVLCTTEVDNLPSTIKSRCQLGTKWRGFIRVRVQAVKGARD